MKKKLLLSLLCGVLVIGLATGCEKNNDNQNSNVNNNDNQNSNENNNDIIEENKSIKDTKYAVYTSDYSKDSRNIDYYWNINTETFDKTKFDKNISFFGNLINTKITAKTLSEAGYVFSETSYYSCSDIFGLKENKDYIQKCGKFTKSNIAYPIDETIVGVPTLINFNNNNDFTSDNVEVYFEYVYTNDYIDFSNESNSIFPYFNGIKYDEINIDMIIENMGVPTYVSDRLASEDYPMTFSYYYVYTYNKNKIYWS